MKKILSIGLCVLMLVSVCQTIAVATPSQKDAYNDGIVRLYNEASKWSVEVLVDNTVVTVTYADNKQTFEITYMAAGIYEVGLQRNFIGQLKVKDVQAAEAPDLTKAYVGKYYPEDFGAVGDGVADDTAAIQAAIDYVSDTVGGGTVILTNRYAFSDVIQVKDGVILEGTSTRQNLPLDQFPWNIPGLVATAPGAQLIVGGWAPYERPGGVRNLEVDGQFIGGQAATSGLVRIQGVSTLIDQLMCHRSAGDGIVYEGTQNSTIIGCESTFHKGVALVLDNGAGALAFQGGYYGSSMGGALLSRDTPGEGNKYGFGSSQITFDGTIFECYESALTNPVINPDGETPERFVHVSGVSIVFTNCNFTGGTQNKTGTNVLIDSSAGAWYMPSSVTFNSCVWWTYKDQYAIRAASSAWVFATGISYVADNGAADGHTPAFICLDRYPDVAGVFYDFGAPHVSITGELFLAGNVNDTGPNRAIKTINGATLTNAFHRQVTGVRYFLNEGQDISVRKVGDAGDRLTLLPDGTIRWANGAGAIAGSLSNVDQTLATSGIFNIRDGLQFEPVTTPEANDTIICDTATGHLFEILADLDASITVTLTNEAKGREVELAILGNGSNTLTFDTHVSWVGGTAPTAPEDGDWLMIRLVYLNGTWIGGRSMSGF